MKTPEKTARREREARRLADLRAGVVAAVRRCRQRIDEMVPAVLSPHDAEILAATSDLDDEVDQLFGQAFERLKR